MQITNHVHSLKIPFHITGLNGQKIGRFVYAYLIYGDEVCLIDSGVAHSEGIIFDYLNETGNAPKDITRLILTHAHPDHIGSAAAIKGLSGCRVYAHELERRWIEDVNLQARERPVPGFFDLVGGSVFVDQTLQEGETLHLGDDLSLRAIHTPGHSPGSISLLLVEDGALFTADAVPICSGMPIYQDIFASIASVERLATLPAIKVLLSAWDEPRWGADARRVFSESREYLKHIHETVLKISEKMRTQDGQKETEGIDPLKLTSNVLAELGLPLAMANPLVATSFLSSLIESKMRQKQGGRFDDEEKIVWLRDWDFLERIGYVLESWQISAIRTGPVRAPAGEVLIGYAVLKKTSPKRGDGGFSRRIFTRKAETMQKDRAVLVEEGFLDPHSECKAESLLLDAVLSNAVDPLKVAAGKPSRRIQPQG